jgi:signal transduction histidine kinase
LLRVFENLIGNAVKYCGERVPQVNIGAELQNGEWVFSVRDNGIGIDPADHARIFEEFQRLHNGSDCPGSGLGLSICRRIVERHQGRIWVDSMPGEGSTFRFTLPATPLENQAASAGISSVS